MKFMGPIFYVCNAFIMACMLFGCSSGPRFVIGQDVVVTKGFFEGCEGKVITYRPYILTEDEFKVELGHCNGVFVGSEVLGKSELKPLYTLGCNDNPNLPCD